MASYYASPSGTSVMESTGLLPPPDGWTEITEEEFRDLLAEHGQDYRNQPVKLLSDVQPTEPPAE